MKSALRTEILRQRIIVDEDDRPLAIAESEEAEVLPPGADASESRTANRAFCDAFIRSVKFDHPDQPPPTHGGNNWVRIKLPPPGRWITGYRYQDRIGLSFVQEESADLSALLEEADQLREETGLEMLNVAPGKQDGVVSIGISLPVIDVGDETAQVAWFRMCPTGWSTYRGRGFHNSTKQTEFRGAQSTRLIHPNRIGMLRAPESALDSKLLYMDLRQHRTHAWVKRYSR